jgi:hypothetical protein
VVIHKKDSGEIKCQNGLTEKSVSLF